MIYLIQFAQETGSTWTGIAYIAAGAALVGGIGFFFVNRSLSKRGKRPPRP